MQSQRLSENSALCLKFPDQCAADPPAAIRGNQRDINEEHCLIRVIRDHVSHGLSTEADDFMRSLREHRSIRLGLG
jgi:hypothetical protein